MNENDWNNTNKTDGGVAINPTVDKSWEKQHRQQLKVQCLSMAQEILKNIPDLSTTDIIARAKEYYKFVGR